MHVPSTASSLGVRWRQQTDALIEHGFAQRKQNETGFTPIGQDETGIQVLFGNPPAFPTRDWPVLRVFWRVSGISSVV
jgi:hypothetical protein